VAGFPLPVQFVVNGPARVVHTSLFRPFNSFNLRLSSEEMDYAFSPRGFLDNPENEIIHDLRGPRMGFVAMRVDVKKNESEEIILDMFDLHRTARPNAAALLPGEYTFRSTESGFEFQPKDDTITVIEPNAEEQKLLQSLSGFAKQLKEKPLWVPWNPERWELLVFHSAEIMNGIDVSKFSDEGRKQLQYHLLLAELVSSEKPLAELLISVKHDELLPAYVTEVLLLEYELCIARGDNEEAQKKRDLILARRPSAAQQLVLIREGGEGVIASYRMALKEKE